MQLEPVATLEFGKRVSLLGDLRHHERVWRQEQIERVCHPASSAGVLREAPFVPRGHRSRAAMRSRLGPSDWMGLEEAGRGAS